jgi:dTDP-4-dehydrorhamnose 3,5-epimerase
MDGLEQARKHPVIFTPCRVADVYLIAPERREDQRGYFARIWCEQELYRSGMKARIVQANVQVNPRAGTLRGLHYQAAPHEEVKIVRCNRGRVFDVAVDLRPGSTTFRTWFGVELRADDGRLLYIPEGCAHGYLTLEPDSEMMYFASAAYVSDAAKGVRFDDAAFGIQWPVTPTVISAADQSWPLLEDARQ